MDQSVRHMFPIFDDSDLVYLDSAASSQKPDQVLTAMDAFMKTSYANIHRGLHHLSQEATIKFEAARDFTKTFVNAQHVDEIIFVRSATEGLNLLASTFGQQCVRAGQAIVISEMDHHSNIVPWTMLAERVGAEILWLPVTLSGELDLGALESILKTHDIALVSLVHVSNVLGNINPIKSIAQLTQRFDIPLIVDGSQAAHHINVNVQDLGCDFYVCTGHKMYGPTGVGFVWGKKNHWDNMIPYHGGGEMVESVSKDNIVYKHGPARFEAGTPNIVGVIGLHAALMFIHEIGLDAIEANEQVLSDYCAQRLKDIKGIKLLPSSDQKIGVYAFELQACHSSDVAMILDQENIAVRVGFHCAEILHQRLESKGSLRVSLGIYNNKHDIDCLVKGLEKAKKLLL